MRIIAPFVILMRDAFRLGHRFAYGNNRRPRREFEEKLLHLRLEIEAMPEHQIGTREGGNIAAGLTVRMRIDPRSH